MVEALFIFLVLVAPFILILGTINKSGAKIDIKQDIISDGVKYQPSVELTLELLKSEPEKWYSTPLYLFHKELDIKVLKDENPWSYKVDITFESIRFLALEPLERNALCDAIRTFEKTQNKRADGNLTKKLAQKIVERESRLLAESRLGDGGKSQCKALGYSPQVPNDFDFSKYEQTIDDMPQSIKLREHYVNHFKTKNTY